MVGGLSTRQFTALETDASLDYFAVSREASLAEVAERLGCAESTASTLVRTADQDLVNTAVGPE